MRADRLISLLMLLQARGRMTARELADELEVSERTVYRDVEALSVSGVPVYGESGPDGGYSLLDSYRTTLTGLAEGEMRALFMLGVPAPLADLGMDTELRQAMYKLAAALPESLRGGEERVRRRFYLDSNWWHEEDEPLPHLATIHRAVWDDHRLAVTYPIPVGGHLTRTVDPYGLVAKAGAWYLVCAADGRMRVYRVAELLDAQRAGETFGRPETFDLAAYWRGWCAERESYRSLYPVTVRVAADFVPELVRRLGPGVRRRIEAAGPPDDEGRLTLELRFQTLEQARERILPMGRGVEVLEPWALRRSVQDMAEQIVMLYGGG